MSDPIRFLHSFAHALGVMTLYPTGHPSRERAIDAAFDELETLTARNAALPSFTFLDDEVVFGRTLLPDLAAWEWGRRLATAGIERIELERPVARDEFDAFLDEVLARLGGIAAETSEVRQLRSLGVRFGAVSVEGATLDAPAAVATLDLALGEEAETFRWLHEQVRTHRPVPVAEAEAVVRSLAVAMHGESRMILPLLQLKDYDQYTTTHSLNVAVLAMALAEVLGGRPRDVRAIGVAGLLHDIGKVGIPREILVKPGRLSDEERAIMRAHPVEGARLLLGSDEDLAMAATVAYEHHIMLDGGGYPQRRHARPCAEASRLVHVCDVYDALCTDRPYRAAWPQDRTIAYLEERAGSEFDPAVVRAFAAMMRRSQTEVRVLAHDAPALP